jgi:hypothetical protein
VLRGGWREDIGRQLRAESGIMQGFAATLDRVRAWVDVC